MNLVSEFLEDIWQKRKEHVRRNPGWKGDGIVFVDARYYGRLMRTRLGCNVCSTERDFVQHSLAFGMSVFPVLNSYTASQDEPPKVTLSFSDNGL